MNSKNKPNGHGPLLFNGGRANGSAISLSGLDRAASDDASELSVANTAASPAAVGADREACAEVAQAEDTGKRPRGAAPRPPKSGGKKTPGEKKQAGTQRETVPGLDPLPVDGEAFVDAVQAQVDLVQLEVDLLRSKDDKITQRELACLRELRYGKRAPNADEESTEIIFDMPGPERDKP